MFTEFGKLKFVNGKALCVVVLKSGDETTELLSLEEITNAFREHAQQNTEPESTNHMQRMKEVYDRLEAKKLSKRRR